MYLRIISIAIVLLATFFACNNAEKNKESKAETQDQTKDTVKIKIDSLSKAIRQTPKEDTLFYQRSHQYLLTGDAQNAVNDLEIAKKLNPDIPQYYLDLAEIELRRGESGIAKDILLACHEKFPNNIETMIRLANIYMAVEKYKEARTYLIKASRINPRKPRLYLLSSMIFQEIGKLERAKEELHKAIKYDPKYYDGHIMLGYINAKQGNSTAIDHYLNAKRLQPQNPEPVYNLGMFYQQNKQYDKALETYRKGLNTIDSTHQHFLFNTGYILENYKSNPDSALYYYQKVIKNYPQDYRPYFRTGLCHEALDQPQKAMASYDMCLKVNPKFEKAYSALSRLSEIHNKN